MRKSKRQAKRRANRLALPRPHPQPRVWAAAARNSPLPGTLPWGQPAPPALELLQSLSDFKQPKRVYTEPSAPPPRSHPLRHSVSVGHVVKAAQKEAHARFRQTEGENREGAGEGRVEAPGREGGSSKVAGAGTEGGAEADSWRHPAERGLADDEGVMVAPGSLASTSLGSDSKSREGKRENEGEEPEMSLEEAVAKAHTVVLNNALTALGAARQVPALDVAFKRVMASSKANSHTWASLFGAYANAGRPDLAVAQFEQACRKGTDIGPMGASALIKLCADQDDLDKGLELFYKMTSTRTTLNRYIYNCLLHLCGAHGRVYDGLDLLAAMRTDGSIQEDCKPDGYTYSALLRAITVSKKWELLPMVYKQMMRDKVEPDAEVWAQLVSLAGRANRTDLAAAYFNAAQASKSPPSSHIYNAMLAAMSRGSKDVGQMMVVYQDMLSLSLVPDAYTYVPLFSALAKAGSSLQDVDALAVEMRALGVQLNTQLGTALLNAYKHVPTMGSPALTQTLASRVDGLLTQLVKQGHANMQTYVLVAAVHAQAGSLPSMQRVLMEAVRARAPPDARALRILSLACEDGGLAGAAVHFMEQATMMKRVHIEAEQRRQGRRGALGR